VEPEKGDKSILVTREDVAAALQSVGVVPGDTVMFHSSLSSMGTVVDGPDTVIDGFLQAVGPAGTVAVPTLCRRPPEERHLTFAKWDPQVSPSYVGLITEVFRQRPEAVRSDHATHSVAAIGARARELTANHGRAGLRPGPWGPRAFAQESPWERFYQWNVAYCFIGVTFRVNTMVHYVESLVVEHALARAAPVFRPQLEAQLTDWMKPGIWPSLRTEDREHIERLLADKGIVRYGKIGSATLRCARARPMIEEWLTIIERDPARWFPPEFQQWLAVVAIPAQKETPA